MALQIDENEFDDKAIFMVDDDRERSCDAVSPNRFYGNKSVLIKSSMESPRFNWRDYLKTA